MPVVTANLIQKSNIFSVEKSAISGQNRTLLHLDGSPRRLASRHRSQVLFLARVSGYIYRTDDIAG